MITMQSISILIWIVVDDTSYSPMRRKPVTRVVIESLINGCSVACVCLLGKIAGSKAREGDWYAGFYVAMTAMLGLVV